MTVKRRIKAIVSDAVKPSYYCYFLEPHVMNDLVPLRSVVSVVVWQGADKNTYLTEITFGSEADYQEFEESELPKVREKIAEVFKDSPVKPHYVVEVLKPDSPQQVIEKFHGLLQSLEPCTVILDTNSPATTEQLSSSGLFPPHEAVPASSGLYSVGLDIGSSTTAEQLGLRGLFPPHQAAPAQSLPPSLDGPESSVPHAIVPPSA